LSPPTCPELRAGGRCSTPRAPGHDRGGAGEGSGAGQLRHGGFPPALLPSLPAAACGEGTGSPKSELGGAASYVAELLGSPANARRRLTCEPALRRRPAQLLLPSRSASRLLRQLRDAPGASQQSSPARAGGGWSCSPLLPVPLTRRVGGCCPRDPPGLLLEGAGDVFLVVPAAQVRLEMSPPGTGSGRRMLCWEKRGSRGAGRQPPPCHAQGAEAVGRLGRGSRASASLGPCPRNPGRPLLGPPAAPSAWRRRRKRRE